ncbi:MAG: ribbon-helix-helix domain-containing protein [Patescibacteria group bacterium]
MPNYNISLNKGLAQIVTTEIRKKKYANRSEFFRDLIRRRYVLRESDVVIDNILPSDPDYTLVRKRKKNASFALLASLRN